MSLITGAGATPGGPGRRGAQATDRGVDMSQYMEEFHKSVHTIPAELQRQLKLIRQLDEKVAELRDKISADCAVYSAAKNKDNKEMVLLREKIDKDQKECLDTADEKVNLMVNLYTQVEGKLRELDDRMAVFDEAMLQQEQMQAGEEEAEEADRKAALAGPGRAEKRKHKSQGLAPRDMGEWLVKGAKVEVKWGEDWWQATIKKVETRGGGSGALSAPGRAAAVSRVLIGYEGGAEDEDEWIEVKSGRLREPQADFHEADGSATPQHAVLGMPPTPTLPSGRFGRI